MWILRVVAFFALASASYGLDVDEFTIAGGAKRGSGLHELNAVHGLIPHPVSGMGMIVVDTMNHRVSLWRNNHESAFLLENLIIIVKLKIIENM